MNIKEVSSDGSLEMDDMIMDQEIDMIDDFVNIEGADRYKNKMKRSFTKKFTGIVKGFFSKAKNKVRDTIHKKKDLPSRDMSRSVAIFNQDDRIDLAPDLEEIPTRESIYSVNLGNISSSHFERKIQMLEIASEEEKKDKVRASAAVRLNPTITENNLNESVEDINDELNNIELKEEAEQIKENKKEYII